MKKIISVLLVFIMILTMVSCGKEETTYANKLEEIKAKGYIVIGTEGDWAPWTYYDESGALVGFDVELGTMIAEILGVEARFEETGWDSLLAGVDSERFDLLCNGVGYTEDRAEKYEFSDPYAYTKTVLIVLGSNNDITSFSDLNGKKTANTASSTYAQLAEEYGATVTPVDDFTQTIELLVQGRIDATLNSEVSYYDYMAQHPDADIKVVCMAEGTKVVLPVKKGEVELIDAINDALSELRTSGQLSELSNKYFNGDITNAE